MFKFATGEYVKNIIYNVISVLLLAVTFIACTIFISNIESQRRITEFFRPYLDENSIIIGKLGRDFDVTELPGYEKSIMTRELYCDCESLTDVRRFLVYDEYSMENLKPRLIEGKHINPNNSEDDIMQVLVSENYTGVGVGDVIELIFYALDETGMGTKNVYVPAKVTGIIASGQKVMMGGGVNISKNMECKDIIGTYSLEQLEYEIVITTEKEILKVGENVEGNNYRCIIKFDDNITPEQRQENYQTIINYEREHEMTGTEVFPEMKVLLERQDEEMKNMMIKYIPISTAILILVTICIVCMISIKNANSMKYYATLYICGMPYTKAVITSGMEMLVNGILSIIVTLVFVEIQNTRSIVGEINCNMGVVQMVIILSICALIVVSTMIITGKILREKSPMNVLKDTVY